MMYSLISIGSNETIAISLPKKIVASGDKEILNKAWVSVIYIDFTNESNWLRLTFCERLTMM